MSKNHRNIDYVNIFIKNVFNAVGMATHADALEKEGKLQNPSELSEKVFEGLVKSFPKDKILKLSAPFLEPLPNNIYPISKPSNLYFNQSLVLLITYFEVFLKNFFRDIIKEPEIKNRVVKLSKRILVPISDLMKNENIEERIVLSFNLDNLKEINDLFRAILGKNLSDFFGDKDSIGLLGKCLDRRHNIVHEGKVYEMTYEEISRYRGMFINFGIKLGMYVINLKNKKT